MIYFELIEINFSYDLSYNFLDFWLVQKRVEQLWNKPVTHNPETYSYISGFSKESDHIEAYHFVKYCSRKGH